MNFPIYYFKTGKVIFFNRTRAFTFNVQFDEGIIFLKTSRREEYLNILFLKRYVFLIKHVVFLLIFNLTREYSKKKKKTVEFDFFIFFTADVDNFCLYLNRVNVKKYVVFACGTEKNLFLFFLNACFIFGRIAGPQRE